MIQLPGLRDCKKSLRYARFEAFVDHAEVKRHGNRSRFVSSRIKKFAVEHDGNRNQARLAFAGKLNQADCAWSGIGCLAAGFLHKFLSLQPISEEKEARSCHRDRQDDARHPVAI